MRDFGLQRRKEIVHENENLQIKMRELETFLNFKNTYFS